MVQTVWRNKRNKNKLIILKRYDCGHYYWAQYIATPWGRQWMGVVHNRCRFSRIRCATWREVLLEDYDKEGGDTDAR